MEGKLLNAAVALYGKAQPHQSRPWNPIIASVFYRAGIIEQWGTGTLKVIDWCRDNSNPIPSWTEDGGSVVVTFCSAPGFAPQITPEVTPEVVKILPQCVTPRSKRELLQTIGIRDEKHFRESYPYQKLFELLREHSPPWC